MILWLIVLRARPTFCSLASRGTGISLSRSLPSKCDFLASKHLGSVSCEMIGRGLRWPAFLPAAACRSSYVISSGFLMPQIYLGSCLWCFLLLCISRVPRPFVTVLAFACILVLRAYYITARCVISLSSLMSSALELALREHFCVDLFGVLCTFISVSGISVTRFSRWRHEVDGARLSVWISDFFLCVFFWRLGTLFVLTFARVEAVCDGFGIRSVCRADVPIVLRLPVIVLFQCRCRRLCGFYRRGSLSGHSFQWCHRLAYAGFLSASCADCCVWI